MGGNPILTKEWNNMSNVLIVFASLTTANKIKKELEKRFGIPSNVLQTPKAIPLKSCSYCIRISKDNLQTAWDFVKKNDVYTKGVYQESDYSKIL